MRMNNAPLPIRTLLLMPSSPPSDIPPARQIAARQRLTRDWLIAAAVAIIVLFLMARLLSSQWVMAAVGRWAIIAGLAIFYELRIFKKILPLMRPPEEQPQVSGVGLAVKLTFLSGLSYALLAGFLLVTPPAEGWLPWIPPMLGLAGLLAAVISDAVTEKRGSATAGGEHLAREFRALGALVITAVAIHYGKLDPWFLVIGVMDYLLLFTGSWLGRKGKTLHQPPARLRHFFHGFYLAALSVILWPVVPPSFAVLLGLLFGLPYFLLSLRDWFILTGLLDPEQSQYRQMVGAVNQALTGWLALSIRLLGTMAAATIAADIVFHFDDYAAGFSGPLGPGAVALMLLVALPFLLVGVRARLFALLGFIALSILLLVMGWNQIIFIALLLLGLTIILGQGKIAIEKEDSANPSTDH